MVHGETMVSFSSQISLQNNVTNHLSQSEGSIFSSFSDLARNCEFPHLKSKAVGTALLKIHLFERYQELVGEYRKHRDGGLSISPTAAKIFQARMVDSGQEAIYLDVIQQITMEAYEQPCQIFNRTVRFRIYWEWYQVSLI